MPRLLCTLTLTLALAACMSYEPVPADRVKTFSGDSDAGSAPEGGAATCASCAVIECAAPWAACQGVAKCVAFFECGARRSCYAAGADVTVCMTPCGVAAGISSADDPAVGPWIGLDLCVTGHCRDACAASP